MKTALKIICGSFVVASIYALLTERKYDLLVKEIKNIRSSSLETIKGQAASIEYRLKTIIIDKQVGESDVVKLAFLIEEFRGLIHPYGVLSNIDSDASKDIYLRTEFQTDHWIHENTLPLINRRVIDPGDRSATATDKYTTKIKVVNQKIKCTLCKGHLKKVRLHKEDDFCILQGSSSL
ncbi:hypothetical protein, partial [Paenibacillus terrigena]|uniref:hypothetical protein n=1 Tax=Paenibacillus terrigena TaxID=369333 RepID=UPI0028D6C84C